MLRALFAFAAASLAVVATSGAALAQKKVALVIGIDAYEKVPRLERAVADARAMAKALEELGFKVRTLENASRAAISGGFAAFEEQIDKGDTAFVFFAGHGVEIRGQNLLLPTDAPDPNSASEGVLKDTGFLTVSLIDRVTDRGARASFFVIDACRNNPYAQPGARRSIGSTRGLAKTEAPEGVFVLMSAGQNQEALDSLNTRQQPTRDTAANSLFTRVFLDELARPGQSHLQLAKNVQTRVRDLAREIGHAQVPAFTDQIIGNVVFRVDESRALAVEPGAAPAPAPGAPPRVAIQSPPPVVPPIEARETRARADMEARVTDEQAKRLAEIEARFKEEQAKRLAELEARATDEQARRLAQLEARLKEEEAKRLAALPATPQLLATPTPQTPTARAEPVELDGLIPADERRIALVIGNGGYRHVPRLVNPVNDAGDVAASLRRLGFAVTAIANADQDGMRQALRNFGREARNADLAVVYYAGHGLEIGGENYLIPVDAELKRDIDVEQEALALKGVILTVSGARKLGLVVLDSARDNPFLASMKRSLPTRTAPRGLAKVEPVGSVLVAFAAKDGTTTDDGTGRNSPFTAALLKHLEAPGLEVNFLFRNVRDDVMRATARRQEPHLYGSLSSEQIFFKPRRGVVR